jgi:hypothetical protein
VPFRAVFAYESPCNGSGAIAQMIFQELTKFYRQRFGADAHRVLEHTGQPTLRWLNLLGAVCIARVLEVEPTPLTVKFKSGSSYMGPAIAAYEVQSDWGICQ